MQQLNLKFYPMKSVYDYIQLPEGNKYDAYAVMYPGGQERMKWGTPQGLLAKGFVVFCSCRKRLAQFVDSTEKKEYARLLKYFTS